MAAGAGQAVPAKSADLDRRRPQLMEDPPDVDAGVGVRVAARA
jgi:hypothetical protein